jgi:hypothetical protein
MTARAALSELLGSGQSRAVVEMEGENRLLTFEAIEALTSGVEQSA